MRECRWGPCQVPAGPNGYYCPNHWKMIPLEIRREINSYPVRPGPKTAGLNSALYRAAAALRSQLPTPSQWGESIPVGGDDGPSAD